MSLFKEDLDGATCDTPGCDHTEHGNEGMYLHGRCHEESGMEVEYKGGEIFVRCLKCKKQVACIAVASKSRWN